LKFKVIPAFGAGLRNSVHFYKRNYMQKLGSGLWERLSSREQIHRSKGYRGWKAAPTTKNTIDPVNTIGLPRE
jgi:hypothetical protein